MKLVLYSGGQSKNNRYLHEACVALARKNKPKGKLSMTYIPFCTENSNTFFNRAVKRYSRFGIKEFRTLNVDQFPSKAEMKWALESDIIYLAGGNTFYFLKHLRESGFMELLYKFAKRGGVIAGLSAGGLILTPTVKLAADKGLGPDENDVKLKDFKGMGLLPFEFSPHFEPTKKQIKAHLAYSNKTENPVFAVTDGSGFVIDGDTIRLVGRGWVFADGDYDELRNEKPGEHTEHSH